MFVITWAVGCGSNESTDQTVVVVDGDVGDSEALGSDAGFSDATEREAGTVIDERVVLATDYPSLQAAIDAAKPGQRVEVPAGTYLLQPGFQFRAGIHVGGQANARPVLRSDDGGFLEIMQDADAPLRDVTLHDMVLENIQITLSGTTTKSTHSNVVFRNLWFAGMPGTASWNRHQLRVLHGSNIVVDRCEFTRSSVQQGGRGIYFYRTHGAIAVDSAIGTTHNWEPAEVYGSYKTAINNSGYDVPTQDGSEEVVISRTVMRRTLRFPSDNYCTYVEGHDGCQDHSVYGWGFRDFRMVGNKIDGWDTSASGGLKLRNAERARVERNHLRDGGFIYYTYERDTQPEYLWDVLTQRNWVDVGSCGSEGTTCGAFYFRNASPPSLEDKERNLIWMDNAFYGDGQIRFSSTNLAGHCIANNAGEPEVVVSNSVGTLSTRDCLPMARWALQPADVYRGDFDADGDADLAWIRGQTWQVHVSDPFQTKVESWGTPGNYSAWTSALGAVVGDFADGNEHDIAYFGECGSPSQDCWRVYRSNGTAFSATNFGNTGGFSEETGKVGLLVGDFDGNGHDDIAYRGECGTERCWRVAQSDGKTFFDLGWGNGAYFSPESVRMGVKVGDFNGDGKSDLAYRGYCGSTRPCFRVQLSEGDKFSTGKDWGDDAYFSADSVHLGLVVGDIDHDGRDDVGYRGYCGERQPRWRYHRSAKEGFEVVCAQSRRH